MHVDGRMNLQREPRRLEKLDRDQLDAVLGGCACCGMPDCIDCPCCPGGMCQPGLEAFNWSYCSPTM
jgi:hypothetical protein